MLIYKAFGWVQHLQNLTFPDLNLIKNPNTLTRMPPTQYILSGGIRPATKLKGTQGTQGDPWEPNGPKGTQGSQGPNRDPRDPKGQGDGALWGLFRSHFEWKAISNERSFSKIFWVGGMRVSVLGLTPFKQTFPRVAASRW